METATASPLPRLLTAKEVSNALSLPLASVYELSRRGELPTVRIGGRQVRYSAPAVREWIERGGSVNGTSDR